MRLSRGEEAVMSHLGLWGPWWVVEGAEVMGSLGPAHTFHLAITWPRPRSTIRPQDLAVKSRVTEQLLSLGYSPAQSYRVSRHTEPLPVSQLTACTLMISSENNQVTATQS